MMQRLMEKFERHTPIDPHASENSQVVAMIFAAQAAPYIRKKLQRTEAYEAKSLSELVSLATRVFAMRAETREAEELKKEKKSQKYEGLKTPELT